MCENSTKVLCCAIEITIGLVSLKPCVALVQNILQKDRNTIINLRVQGIWIIFNVGVQYWLTFKMFRDPCVKRGGMFKKWKSLLVCIVIWIKTTKMASHTRGPHSIENKRHVLYESRDLFLWKSWKRDTANVRSHCTFQPNFRRHWYISQC